MGFAVAIDGPSGSGKSTAAKLLAEHYGYIYIDTGGMYRAVGLYCLQNGINTQDAMLVALTLESGIELEINFIDGRQRILLEQYDVTDEIRTQEVARCASNVAKFPFVREWLVRLQRKMAEGFSVVMDGRDIGTVVLPNADVKIYLDASAESRAERRLTELLELGEVSEFETVKKEIEQRDYEDMNREVSPLRKADDAIFIDTSSMSIDEVKQAIINIVDSRV